MQKQAYLALGNLLTVCAIEDIDACPIEGFDPEKYDTYFNLNPNLKSGLLPGYVIKYLTTFNPFSIVESLKLCALEIRRRRLFF